MHLVACYFYKDARVHCEVLKIRASPEHPTPNRASSVTGPQESVAKNNRPLRTQQRAQTTIHPPTFHSHPKRQAVLTEQASQWPQVNVPHSGSSPDRKRSLRNQAMDNPTKKRDCQKLLRKEVIQPHLPVRLPCYDLVLITGPTFDGSLHKGWATGFRCYRLS